jgi:Cyclin, C-terminal domain
MLAAACFSLALLSFQLDSWAPVLQAISGYRPEDLSQAKEVIIKTQAVAKACQLRRNFVHRASVERSPEFVVEWQQVCEIVKNPGALPKLPVP